MDTYVIQSFDGQEIEALLQKIDNLGNASTSEAGLMSAADKTKLNGIESGAEVNDLESVSVGGTALPISGKNVNLPTDAEPTSGSSKFVLSGAVYNAVQSMLSNLAYYYLKTETYSKGEVDALVAAIKQFSYTVADSLPTASAETMYIIYLVPSQNPQVQNAKDEYITVRSGSVGSYTYAWEQIGSTVLDVSGKADKVSGATNGHLAGLDSNGNLTDSGKAASDFATAAQGGKADTAYQKPSGGIPATDLASGVQTSLGKADSAYQKPAGGVPKTDLASDVQTSLGKADSAIQDVSGKADKDTDAVEGNVAKFDANGNSVDGGVPAENVAQKDGYYEQMGVGIAKNLEGRSDVIDSFLERTTGGDAEVANGLAQITEVKGKSQVWNQLCPFTSAPVITNATWTNNTLLATAQNGQVYWSAPANSIIVGHKYIQIAILKTTAAAGQIRAFSLGELINLYNVAASGSYQVLAGIATASNTLTPIAIRDNRSSGWDAIEVKSVMLLDLTLLGIDSLTTVAEVEAWLAQNIGLREYYPYNAGEVLNNKMRGIESLGFNLLDPATGKARIVGAYSDVYGNYYGITGTHGTITFTSDLGETSEITPDSDGKFLLEEPGTLNVATPGADCAVFLWWDGTRTEYEDYDREVANLDVQHIYGKLNGTGELVRVWPTGMPGIGDVKDSLKVVDGAVVAKRVMGEVDLGSCSWVKNADKQYYSNSLTPAAVGGVSTDVICAKYPAGNAYSGGVGSNKICTRSGFVWIADTSNPTAAALTTSLSGIKLYYELASEQVYTDLVYQGSSLFADGTPVTLPVPYHVSNWGLERIIPQNDTDVVTAKPEISCRYSIDAVETLNTHTDEIEDLYDKIEELDERKPEKYGSYPAMAVGSAKVLDGDTVQSAEFTFRKTGEPTPVGSGLAMMRQVMGKSLVWNQLVFGCPSKSEIAGITRTSVSNYCLHYQGTSEVTQSYTGTATNINVIGGHKYYCAANGCPSSCAISAAGASAGGRVKSVIAAPATTISFSIAITIPQGVSIDTDIYFVCIDLTLMFGAGNEPTTVAEFEKMYPLPYYAYNAGQIVNNAATGIEVVGFNQWDEEWEGGGYNLTTGEKATRPDCIRCKNLIPVFPNTIYYGKYGSISNSSQAVAVFYDAGGNFLEGINSSNNYIYIGNSTFTTPVNAAYMAFYAIGTTYANDICINLSDASRNGQYEAYKKETVVLNLPTLTGKLNGEGESVTLCSDGAKSAGSVYDEFVVENGYITKFVKRIGQVDMGTLTWGKSTIGEREFFYGSNPGTPLVTSNTIANCLCSKYEMKSWATMVDKTMSIFQSVASATPVLVMDSSYSDAASFKTAMSGVMLNYELAEPMTYILDTPIYVGYTEDADGTEKRLPEDTASVVNAPFAFSVVYPVDVVRQLDEMPQDYDTTASLDALCTALATTLSSALNGTLTITRGSFDATNQKYSFTVNFTPNA